MMRYFFYSLGLCLILGPYNLVQAQAPQHNHAQCGVSWEDAQAVKNRMLDNRRQQSYLMESFNRGRSGTSSTVYIPVQFHIVNKSDGSGGESVQDVLDNLCKLNDDFAFINVEFYMADPIRYINQDLLYTNDYNGMASYFMSLYLQPNAVNIFVGNQIVSGVSGGTTLAYYTPSLDAIYAIKSAVNGQSWTLTHEVGHYFSLPHTFSGWEGLRYDLIMGNTTGRTPTYLPNGAAVEKIVRSGGSENCQIAGDGFCDTEPNYLFGFYGGLFNDGPNFCTHNSSAIDPEGILFRPDRVEPSPSRFKMSANNPEFTELMMRNNFAQQYYPKTLINNKTFFTPTGGMPIPLSDVMLGDSDSTDFTVSPLAVENIIGTNALEVDLGVITMGEHIINQSLSTNTTGVTANAPAAEFTVDAAFHTTSFSSMDVTNTTGSVIPANTVVITVQEDMSHNTTGLVSSETWTILLSVAIPANTTVSVPLADLYKQKNSIAGGVFSMTQAAPNQVGSGTGSNNIMSYYGDCVNSFSGEQGVAMQLDIASRGLATLYPAPTAIQITGQATGINPSAGITTASATVSFSWNTVNGATHYHVYVYQVDVFGNPLLNGEKHDFITTNTAFTGTLSSSTNYAWEVTPLNEVSFCDAATTSNAILFTTGLGTSIRNTNIAADLTKVYPNPLGASKLLTIELVASKVGTAQISVMNSLGQLVMPWQAVELIEGTNVHQMNTSTLVEGLYLINIETEKGLATHKLMIRNE